MFLAIVLLKSTKFRTLDFTQKNEAAIMEKCVFCV